MTEQVIDIRDRIEKMRTQMTGSNSVAVEKEKKSFHSGAGLSKKNEIPNKIEKLEPLTNLQKPDLAKKIKNKDFSNNTNIMTKPEKVNNKNSESSSPKFSEVNFNREEKVGSQKVYKDYHNDNMFDEHKKSVKLDDDKPFPQFNLNVSNPISWKLMLLIMLMQLLTNIMLVVVLYLK